MVVALVAFFAARSALPEQVRGFRGGRLALAVLITLALWIGGALLCAIALVALMLFGGTGEIFLLLAFGALELALLWPFSRLGLRWGYTVSYTHLDVYKRQVPGPAARSRRAPERAG